MKIVDKRKFINFLIVVITLFILFACIVITNEKYELDHMEEYTVKSGETLWSICTNYRPDNMSIQEYIYNIEEQNDITPMIYAGQKIQLLIYKEV